jgi:hypothetical protein
MLRIALALALGFSVAALTGVVTADDKKAATKTLEGKLVCTKCKLSETDKCGNALQVTEGGKTVTYYIQDKGKGEKYHKCSGEQAAKVTGKVSEKDGKKVITDAKVEKQ